MRSILKKIVGKIALSGFRFCETFGLHITPDKFDYPIPSTKDLTDYIFRRKSDCIGIDWNNNKQEDYLKNIFPKYATEVEFESNEGLSLVDAAIYHAMIRHNKPRKIIEIGSGSSTRFAASACIMNETEGIHCELVAIEPFPTKELRKGFPGLARLIENKVQSVDLKEFEDCDLLFIDSSHVVKIGGDVNYEILEIIPRLKKDCLVHFHDILLPGEYWKDWVMGNKWFWSEQYLLQAFMQFNRDFEIMWASRYQHLNNELMIKDVFPYFEQRKHRITSFWIRRKA